MEHGRRICVCFVFAVPDRSHWSFLSVGMRRGFNGHKQVKVGARMVQATHTNTGAGTNKTHAYDKQAAVEQRLHRRTPMCFSRGCGHTVMYVSWSVARPGRTRGVFVVLRVRALSPMKRFKRKGPRDVGQRIGVCIV